MSVAGEDVGKGERRGRGEFNAVVTSIMYMLQSIWKLGLLANGVTGSRPLAYGLTFQTVCHTPG